MPSASFKVGTMTDSAVMSSANMRLNDRHKLGGDRGTHLSHQLSLSSCAQAPSAPPQLLPWPAVQP